MVLTPSSRRRAPPRSAWVLVLAACSLAACLASAAPSRLPEPTKIAVQLRLEGPDGAEVDAGPQLRELLTAELLRRNLVTMPLAVDLDQQRTTSRRLEATVADPAGDGSPWVLLIEARARFFSQLSGRYRWEVEVRTTLASRAAPADAQASDLSVAAFLQYEHEGAGDAIAFVRRQLVDDVLGLVDRVVSTDAARRSP